MKIIILLPVYNEAKSLAPLLKRIELSMSHAGIPYRIILVDDGSTDGSLAIARSLACSLPLSLLLHRKNKGLGNTIRDGFRLAMDECCDDDVVVTMDADNSQPPELIPRMLKRLEGGFDVAIASRYAPGAKTMHVPLYRRAISRLGNLAYSLSVRAGGVRDYTCGFRAYKSSMLKRGLRVYGDRLVSSPGFECMAEILIRLRSLGARFVEIPFALDYGAKPSLSKMKLTRTLFGNLRVLVVSDRLRSRRHGHQHR